MANNVTTETELRRLQRDSEAELRQKIELTNKCLASTASRLELSNKELAATVSRIQETNRELTSAVSRAISALSKLKHRRSLLAGFQRAQNSPPDTNSSSSHNPVV
jgi:hypothetical protein